MAEVRFSVACSATYETSLTIPNNITNDREAVLNYIHEHLHECIIENLEWMNDLEPEDAVNEYDIQYISDED